MRTHGDAHTFDCISSIVRKAEALCLKPPKAALAGLSAETIVTVPLNLVILHEHQKTLHHPIK